MIAAVEEGLGDIDIIGRAFHLTLAINVHVITAGHPLHSQASSLLSIARELDGIDRIPLDDLGLINPRTCGPVLGHDKQFREIETLLREVLPELMFAGRREIAFKAPNPDAIRDMDQAHSAN